MPVKKKVVIDLEAGLKDQFLAKSMATALPSLKETFDSFLMKTFKEQVDNDLEAKTTEQPKGLLNAKELSTEIDVLGKKSVLNVAVETPSAIKMLCPACGTSYVAGTEHACLLKKNDYKTVEMQLLMESKEQTQTLQEIKGLLMDLLNAWKSNG